MSWFILRGQVSPKMLASLADLARTEEGREAVISADLLPQLLNRVGADSGEEMALQACRHHHCQHYHHHHHLRNHYHHHHHLAGLPSRRQPVFRLALWQSAGRGGWPLEVVVEVVIPVSRAPNRYAEVLLGQCSCPHRADSWALFAQTLVIKYLW